MILLPEPQVEFQFPAFVGSVETAPVQTAPSVTVTAPDTGDDVFEPEQDAI